MQYTHHDICAAMDCMGEVEVKPFDRLKNLKGNFLELHLGKNLLLYTGDFVDCGEASNPADWEALVMDHTGFIMPANQLVLGVTHEWTRFDNCQSQLHGKSSLGRMGLAVHITAGAGDAGFRGHWTLEMLCPHPIRVYPGMPIAQVELRKFKSAAPAVYAGRYNNAPEGDPWPKLSKFNESRAAGDWLVIP